MLEIEHHLNLIITHKCDDWERSICKTRYREPVVGANRSGAAILNHP